MDIGKKVVLAIALVASQYCHDVDAAGPNSKYKQLGSDVRVNVGTSILLAETISLTAPGWVYVQSDGRYYPGGAALANAYITINGEKISNDSLIDWRGTSDPQQHSFNVIGAKHLPAGQHTVVLHGVAANAPAYFGAGSNLSVLTDAATQVAVSVLGSDTAQLNFDTTNTPEGSPIPTRGRTTILSVQAGNTAGPLIAMVSGRNYVWGNYGDAMWGIFLNGQEPNIDSMTWSINDLWKAAELQAPMFAQAMFMTSPSNSSVQLVASESPYYYPVARQTNEVKYRIGANARLIALSGGISVSGKALNPGFSYDTQGQYRRYAYVCIGTNGYNTYCPPTGSEVVLGQGQVCIPSWHNGVVLFSAKSRVQGDMADSGGTVSLQIKINGQPVGSTGVQQLGPAPNSESTRTISASYLSAGSSALPEGCHTAQVVARADGDFRNISMNADLPLLWFD